MTHTHFLERASILPKSYKFDEKDFELVFQHSVLGIGIVGMDGKWLKVNEAMINTFGYFESEMMEMTFQDITHPEDINIGIEAMKSLSSGRADNLRLEKRYIHKNGRVVHAIVSTAVVRDEEGVPKYLVSQVQDISEQKRAELQANLIVDSTFDGYWDWVIQEDYKYMSPRFWEMFGYDPADKRHHPSEWIEVIFPEDREKTLRNFELHAKSKGTHPFYQESRFRHADGSTVWVICKGAVIEWDRNGKPLRMVGTHTDITALKQAQQALAQSSKMVALGEMAGGVAHEINNPLAVIMGHANRLRSLSEKGGLTKEDVLETSHKLEKTALRISKIVKGLRVYSREVDNEELQDVLVSELIDDTLSFCMEKFRSYGIQIIVDVEPSHAQICCRPIQISQVLLNLLNNSFDAIKNQADRWIEIKFSMVSEGSRIEVSDSGKGIPSDIQDKIMEPFFTTKPVGVGTGLGLSICSGIVSAHGGVLTLLQGRPHTTFRLALPCKEFLR